MSQFKSRGGEKSREEQGGEEPSEKVKKLLPGDTGLAEDGPQGAFGDLFVVGHREPAVRRSHAPQNNVAPGLVIDSVAKSFHDLAEIQARKHR